jgi:orotate phosphoribosyltransferase
MSLELEVTPLASLLDLLAGRSGHFALESGHHGELWLDLELLFLRPERVRPYAVALARKLEPHRIDAVCGPLVEGAFVALQIASELGVPFAYAERHVDPHAKGLFPVSYGVPGPLREVLRGKRVAVVNDVVNAGSAVKGALVDLAGCGASPIVIATLLVLGDAAAVLAAKHGVALETLATLPSTLWEPDACPLCRQGLPLSSPHAAGPT